MKQKQTQQIQYIQQERFQQAKKAVLSAKRHDKGIGTLSEKTVHSVLKKFFEPEEDNHEVALEGYFADIYNENGVIEIQTRSFERLREKLAVFLNHYPVTIVYPMPCNKWVFWVDEQTGEVSEPRKSPRHYTVYDAFTELYKIKQYLHHPQLTVKLVLMDMQEYKTLQQKIHTKKGIRRHGEKKDRIPIGIREIVTIEQLEDYMQFVPYELEGTFTSADFAKAAHIPVDTARITLNILKDTQTVTRVGKQGRSYLYEGKENNRCM